MLAYLESAGYPYAPRYLGVDDGGRDILSYIPGQTTDHPSQPAEGAYARGGAVLRLLHETTAGHRLAAGDKQKCERPGLSHLGGNNGPGMMDRLVNGRYIIDRDTGVWQESVASDVLLAQAA